MKMAEVRGTLRELRERTQAYVDRKQGLGHDVSEEWYMGFSAALIHAEIALKEREQELMMQGR